MKITTVQFDIKCNDIAKFLGGLYVPEPESYCSYGEIILANSTIRISCDGRTGRAEISGSWPSNCKNEIFRPSTYEKSEYAPISCSFSRDAKAIANDIERRFLPAYLGELRKQEARVKDSNKFHATTEENTARLHHVSCGKRYDRDRNEICLDHPDIHGRVKVSGNSVSIEFNSLTPAQAETLLTVYRNL